MTLCYINRHLTIPSNSELEILHMSPLGSGSHIPFSLHVAVWGPISSSPEGQLKVTVVPSTGMRSSVATTFGTGHSSQSFLSENNISGWPQLAMRSKNNNSVLLILYQYSSMHNVYSYPYIIRNTHSYTSP